jgi:hypothetical protein
MQSFTERMVGAATLNVYTYEEVEADTTATGQAAAVVAIMAVASAIGNVGRGGEGALAALITALVGWLIWAGITYFIGTRFFGGTATWGELLRTLGFAQSPGVLYVLGIIPLLGGLIQFAVGIWILVAGIIAIRQALDVSTGKAILTAIVGWLVVVILGVLVAVLGFGAAAVGGAR